MKRTILPLSAAVCLALAFIGTAVAEEPLTAPPDVAAPPEDAQVYASGLASKVLRPGTGTEHPDPTSHVIVHYAAWKADGELFDSSYTRGKRASLDLNVMIDGFVEGLQLMVVGEKRRARRAGRGGPAPGGKDVCTGAELSRPPGGT